LLIKGSAFAAFSGSTLAASEDEGESKNVQR